MTLAAILLTLLQVFDGWTTYKILRLGGRDLNPVVRWIMEKIGEYEGLVVIKTFGIVLVWVIALNSINITPVLLAGLGIFYGLVTMHNYKVLLGMK